MILLECGLEFPEDDFIGLDNEGVVSTGYDGIIYAPDWDNETTPTLLTKADRAVLADIMIKRWTEFKI